MVRALDIPPQTIHAFIDALEAWGVLEHELFMIWQFLKGPQQISDAWEQFTRLGTSEQRKSTEKLVSAHFRQTNITSGTPEVFGRLVTLTNLRNRIVHGRWFKIDVLDELNRKMPSEYLRIYDARGESITVSKDGENEIKLRGQSRFYEKDLRDAELDFRVAARDLHHLLAFKIFGATG